MKEGMKGLLLVISCILITNCAVLFPCPRKDTVIMNRLGCPTFIPEGALDGKALQTSPGYLQEMLDEIEEECKGGEETSWY